MKLKSLVKEFSANKIAGSVRPATSMLVTDAGEGNSVSESVGINSEILTTDSAFLPSTS